MLRTLAGFLVVAELAWGATDTDALPRRGFFGAAIGPITNDLSVKYGLSAGAGAVLDQVFPDSAASTLDLRASDIVLDVGGVEITGGVLAPQSVVQLIGRYRAGDEVSVTIRRDGETLTKVAPLVPLPQESASDYETLYRSVEVNGARLRVIFTKPKGEGRFPLMFYVQGLGCGSVEAPHSPDDPIRKFIAGVTEAGYATMRVEKSGTGDSQGPPCSEIDFTTEMAGYRAACEFGFTQEFVDPEKVFLFGHSMGGVFAPLLSESFPVAGVIVYGTISKPLDEYFVENGERQFRLQDWSESLIASQVTLVRDFNQQFFTERKALAAIIESDPKMRGFLSFRSGDETHFFGRHYSFWFGLDDLDMAAHWKAVKVPVLVLWGQSDVAASRGDHVLINETVNAAHPGAATFIEFPNMDHGFGKAPTMKDSLGNQDAFEFNDAIVKECAAWMGRVSVN